MSKSQSALSAALASASDRFLAALDLNGAFT